MTDQLAIAGLTVSPRPAPPARSADWREANAREARAALIASALKKATALAVQIADDEAWCQGVERKLRDPAFAHIPASDPMRVQARDEIQQVRSRIDDLEGAFADCRADADEAWGKMSQDERRATGLELADGLEPWAMWFHLSGVLTNEYDRAGST